MHMRAGPSISLSNGLCPSEPLIARHRHDGHGIQEQQIERQKGLPLGRDETLKFKFQWLTPDLMRKSYPINNVISACINANILNFNA